MSFLEKCLRKLGHHYIPLMMVATRIFGSVGGLLVIYYTELTLELPAIVRVHFRFGSIVVVILGCTLTVLLAQWETRTLRRILRKLAEGREISPEEASEAGREAVLFVGRHHRHEAWLVPCSTLVPLLIYLKIAVGISSTVVVNITAAVFMGIAMALMSTFFVVEYCMAPVVRYLLDQGIRIEYGSLPTGRLRLRFRLCFGLIIVTTALMIGTLARQRAADILTEGLSQGNEAAAVKAVDDLRVHSTYITVAAVIVGMVFSTLLANSVASRGNRLVAAMERVGKGSFSERVQPTGNDEIDVLARQFNAMVQQLEHNHETIRDLNSNLEYKVRERTHQLELALQELREAQVQLTDAAHRAGMAEIATGVLHNVGNVLNSVNVSTTVLNDRLRRSRLEDLPRFVSRLEQKGADLPAFLAEEGRSAKLIEYLSEFATRVAEERGEMLGEVRSLTEKIDHIRDIIAAQQSFARKVSFREEIDLKSLLGDIIRMHEPSIRKHGIEVVRDFDELSTAYFEKAKLVQVVDNLVKNAIESMSFTSGTPRVLTLTLTGIGSDRVSITVADTGEGISAENMDSLFRYGFTTKHNGNGFGLHSSALAISEMGGTVAARSDGVGCGAAFTLEFPLRIDEETSPSDAPRDAALAVG